MKTILKVLLVLLGLVLLSFVGLIIYAKFFYSSETPAESYYVENLPLKSDSFQDDFHEITEIVKDNYSLYESKHLNIDSICDSYSSRVELVSTSREYGELLKEFFASLKVGHSFVYLKEYSTGTFPVFINDSIFLSNPNDILIAAGLKDKDRVIAINGEPTAQWMDRNEKYVSASTPLNRRLYTATDLFRSLSDTTRNYTVCRGNDTIVAKLPLLPIEKLPSSELVMTSSKVLDDSIGYIAVNTMMDGVLDSFKSDFDKVRDLPYIIVDIRNNEGGNSGNGRELCRYFIHKNQPHCIDNKLMTPEDIAYHGKVILLISPITFSAAESFAIDMKESGNVILIGQPTAGDTGNRPKTFKTSNGICFRIPTAAPSVSPQGFPLEGVGIVPDFLVSQNVADYFNDIDTQLDFAIKYFKNN